MRDKKLAQYAEKRSWESPREDQAELMRALAREIMGRSKRGHK